MSRCLVTGGAGFIGAHVSRALLDDGHEVTIIDDLSGGHADNLDPRARFVRCDVVDQGAVEKVFRDGRFEVVYHFAAFAAEGLSHFIKRFIHTNIVIGSVNLINAAVGYRCRCFVFASSIAVYGSHDHAVDETVVPLPEDSYGIAKRAVELELEATRRMFGLDYVIFRPHNVYGELQNLGDRYRNVIGIFMNQAMRGAPLSIFGDGEQTRAFSYVADVVPPIVAAPWTAGAVGEMFNVGVDQPTSINELARLVCAAIGCEGQPVVHHPARLEARHAVSDHAKLERVFGPVAATPLSLGLARMAAWARDVGPREPSPFFELELDRNLPSAWKADSPDGE